MELFGKIGRIDRESGGFATEYLAAYDAQANSEGNWVLLTRDAQVWPWVEAQTIAAAVHGWPLVVSADEQAADRRVAAYQEELTRRKLD